MKLMLMLALSLVSCAVRAPEVVALGPGPCARYFVLDPPAIAKEYDGKWLQSLPIEVGNGCPTFPHWVVMDPEGVTLTTFHRPNDIGNNTPDPNHLGNWARIPERAGTYTIRTENGQGGFTDIEFTISLPFSVGY